MESASGTWPLALRYLSDLFSMLLCALALFGTTIVIHWVGQRLLAWVKLPRLTTLLLWLEYYVWCLGALLFAGILTRISFDLLRHILHR